MAVEARKTAQIANMDAVPIVMAPANIMDGNMKVAVGTVEVVNADSIASTYRMVRLPSNAIVQRVLLSCDAITSAAADVGVYQTAQFGGAVVDADFFASAQSIASALVNTDVTHEADAADAGAGNGLADAEKMLWQGLGLTADPGRDYDIVATLTAAATATGTLTMRVFFTTNQ
jgi:hypothetical protein